MTTPLNLAFIGLGVMGAPMASHLAAQGHQLTVYNRSTQKADRWLEQHPSHAKALTPAEAASEAQVVFLCVGNDEDVREVIQGAQGVLQQLKPGSLIIDHTTASAALAQEMAAVCSEKGVDFLDAPVSGGQQGAEKGQLTVMVGGEASAYQCAEPLIKSFAQAVTLMGPSGSGQMTKMVNQICIGGLLQALAEGLHFADQAGLDQQKVIDVISRGAAGSWQMSNRHLTMIAGEYNHGFAVDWMRKDLGICLQQADQLGASLPVTALVDQFYKDVQNLGGGRWDTSSLLKRLESLYASK